MSTTSGPFIGSEAIASGMLNRHQLRTRFRAIHPNVYVPRDRDVPLDERIEAAWLWSGRDGVIAGLAAASLHGAKWIDDGVRIDLICESSRAPAGVAARRFLLFDDEWQMCGPMPVTTPARTAFDVGRRGSLTARVAKLDALCQATGFKVEDVLVLIERHPGSPGLRHLETALDLVDAGAQSPKESWLRLLLIRAGLPRPETQIPVPGADGHPIAFLDMGWERWMIAVEYDGDQHRTDRRQYVKDIRRIEMLERLGWIVIRVVAEDRPADIITRIRDAIARRESTVR